MNVLILNRESFSLPGDGWYQVAPLGEFPHAASGVVQVVDEEACREMVRAFGVEASGPNFAGLLIDFDHFSLNTASKSEAGGGLPRWMRGKRGFGRRFGGRTWGKRRSRVAGIGFCRRFGRGRIVWTWGMVG